jgi:hypothetical protein
MDNKIRAKILLKEWLKTESNREWIKAVNELEKENNV